MVFATTLASIDQNLYFHDRSWLSNESMLIFVSDRMGRTEPFGYIEATGELARLGKEGDAPLSGLTCSREGNCLYGIRGGDVLVWSIDVKMRGSDTSVHIRERKIGSSRTTTEPSRA